MGRNNTMSCGFNSQPSCEQQVVEVATQGRCHQLLVLLLQVNNTIHSCVAVCLSARVFSTRPSLFQICT